MKNTVATFRQAKGNEKLAMLTCYDYTMARLMDNCGLNALLVGDSLGMVMLGYPDTVSVSMEEMIHHCAAVSRGADNALLVCDMPFMSSQCGVEATLRNAGRLLKEGHAQAVKLEGGSEFAPEVAALTRASIPVMAHIGLRPQSINQVGGYRVQGKDQGAAQKLMDDARALEQAGAFALLLECVPSALARKITAEVSIPVIGIGAGPHCDGQVLVWQDLAGLGASPAKFVKKFADAHSLLASAFSAYVDEVKTSAYPDCAHSYAMDEAVLAQIR